jgi:hypothetical protein
MMTVTVTKIVFLFIFAIISLFRGQIAPWASDWPSFTLCLIAIVFLW